jgi:vitamin B12 transporter
VNRTSGSRRTIETQVARRFSTGAIRHRLILAAESEHETFHASDVVYGGLTNQDRSRDHNALTAEWRASTSALAGDVAVRRDLFNRFKDATSLRASLLARLGSSFVLTGAYSQGISQPTFFDLYGFFPGNFAGNPSLKPESSRGFETSLRYSRGALDASLTAYRQRLRDEIVDVTDPTTFLQTTINQDAVSHRAGVEAAIGWRVGDRLRLSANYTFLHATEPDSSGIRQTPELRRPKHSGSIAADGSVGRWTYGASLAFVGSHLDTADNYPFGIVSLHSYWLADARLAYAVRPGLQIYARGSNLLDSRYEDSAGYRTEGRGVFLGIRLADRRSSR